MFINDTGGFIYSELLGEYSYPVPPEPVIVEEETEETETDN